MTIYSLPPLEMEGHVHNLEMFTDFSSDNLPLPPHRDSIPWFGFAFEYYVKHMYICVW